MLISTLIPSLGMMVVLAVSPKNLPEITNVIANWNQEQLNIFVATGAPLALDKSRAYIADHNVWIELPGATLNRAARRFGKKIKSKAYRQNKNNLVSLKIPYGNRQQCREPIELSLVAGGFQAKVACATASASKSKSDSTVKALQAALDAVSNSEANAKESTPVVLPTRGHPGRRPVSDAQSQIPKSNTSANEFWKLSLLALIVLGLIAAVIVLARRKNNPSRWIKILEVAHLGPKRSLIVARIGGQTLLLGSSESSIALLASLPETENIKNESVLIPSRGEPVISNSFQPTVSDDYGQAGLLSRLLKSAFPTKEANRKPQFDSFLMESAEDQELRRKLDAGLCGRIP